MSPHAGISLMSPEPTGRGGGARCTPHVSLNARAITLAAVLVMLALSVPPLSPRNVPADAGAGSNSRNSARTMLTCVPAANLSWFITLQSGMPKSGPCWIGVVGGGVMHFG